MPTYLETNAPSEAEERAALDSVEALVAFVREYAPSYMQPDVLDALSLRGTAARAIFDLGREYERRRDGRRGLGERLEAAKTEIAFALFASDPEVVAFVRSRSEARYDVTVAREVAKARPPERAAYPVFLDTYRREKRVVDLAWKRREPKGARERSELRAVAFLEVFVGRFAIGE